MKQDTLSLDNSSLDAGLDKLCHFGQILTVACFCKLFYWSTTTPINLGIVMTALPLQQD